MEVGADPTPAAFPFSAIVGQDRLKLALLLNAVDARIGGVLIRGEKGTAKSTAVRALAHVMPPLAVVEGCRFACDPARPDSWCAECRERRASGALRAETRPVRLVELPVSASEDRLVGSIDIGRALREGERSFEPGLLASANRAILYVDEVNLLEDHLVDTLLDAAAMGVNTVEREGVSFSHPSRFVLIGTMNPEEGEVRPQLLDRFGLCVDVTGERDPGLRVEIMRRRREFDADPVAFAASWTAEEGALRGRLRAAASLLPDVVVSDELLYAIANLALTVGVDGHRADQGMARAAAAHAALDGRGEATLADVRATAPLVLAHRTKRSLFAEPQLSTAELASVIVSVLAEPDSFDGGPSSAEETTSPGDGHAAVMRLMPDTAQTVEPVAIPGQLTLAVTGLRTTGAEGGHLRHARVEHETGRHTRSVPAGAGVSAGEVALEATIRAAAFNGAGFGADGDAVAVNVRPEDLQRKVRTRAANATIVFCVDASGSMGVADRLEVARTALLDLLGDAYRRRDRVALVTFHGEGAQVVLAPTASVELARMRLGHIGSGGATPLAAGLLESLELLERERRRESDLVPWLVLLTDGRANVGLAGGRGSADALSAARKVRSAGVNVLVVDPSRAGGDTEYLRELASAAGARRVVAGDGGHMLARAVRTHVTDT